MLRGQMDTVMVTFYILSTIHPLSVSSDKSNLFEKRNAIILGLTATVIIEFQTFT